MIDIGYILMIKKMEKYDHIMHRSFFYNWHNQSA